MTMPRSPPAARPAGGERILMVPREDDPTKGKYMTTYAYDPAARDLVAVWPVGIGSQLMRVVSLGDTVPQTDVLRLCQELSSLSAALWDTYVHPPSAVDDPEDVDQQRWRREQTRTAVDEVEAGLRHPNLPDESGLMIGFYDPVEEASHRVGRALHQIGDSHLLESVVTEVQRETEAVAAAELGDLSGRAAQAVALDRVDASPAQVHAADHLLHAEPWGAEALFGSVDPAAACVAAAHWLTAAAAVAAMAVGVEPWEVFERTDDIQACSVEVPSLVVEAVIEHEASPRQVVMALLSEAAAVRAGELPDVAGILAGVRDAIERAERVPDDQREAVLDRLMPSRATLLNPARAARDLLEHLLDGIHSALVLFDAEADDEQPAGENTASDPTNDDHQEPDDAADAAWHDRMKERFWQAVRADAITHADRLT